jgi:hypothetical protein
MNDDDSDKYAWIAFIDRLSGGDITKHDLIYERNYIECLNLLSYWKSRDDAERLAQKMNNRR